MEKWKQRSKFMLKASTTVIAFIANPALGIFVGVWLFLGFDTFAKETR
jgi:hypothetical protein